MIFCQKKLFTNWGIYVQALRETKTRLKDRVLSRSSDQLELHGIRDRSQHQMKKSLNWFDLVLVQFDLVWFGIGAVMVAGIFVLTGEATKNLAGPAVLLSYVISGTAALLSVLFYSEFSVEIPLAGGSFAYLRVELGDFVAFIAAGNILFEYVVSGAGVARSWTSYFATLCNHKPNDFRINVSSLAEGYNHLDPIAVVILLVICAGASLSTKGSSQFNSIMTIIHLVVMVFILVVGLTQANLGNYSNFATYGARGVLKAAAMLFFAYVGFDGIATLGKEIKNPGMNWAKYIVAIGALIGMTTVLLASIISQARYFTHIARTHMAPPFLAAVNEKTGTPVTATVVMVIANCTMAFFTSLDILANLVSIATLFVFSLVPLALLVRRYYMSGETPDRDRDKLILFLVLITLSSSIGSGVFWAISENTWIGCIIKARVWFIATLGLNLTLKEARKPKVWGLPLMPWLPSASIAINVFIMCSIDGASFVRFSVWTAVLLVYYLLIGLHATYDAAKDVENKGTNTTDIDVIAARTNAF
ncbi:Cationic amino acid transporter 1 [Capsicum baccatum]|uniref:Cationic amino acid transporter 1 n=1 Tax=Capsicum baccatum TaxID=33114 RepID=A0A2G2XE78_CAPBA|nr:Cationic amino acid transporter 1 [Capsicum baccatum]